jgi:hypothetical protein
MLEEKLRNIELAEKENGVSEGILMMLKYD